MDTQLRYLARGIARATLVVTALALPTSAAQAAVITLDTPATTAPTHLTDGSYLFGITVMLTPDQFLLPILATGAVDLETWQVDVAFDPSVVQVVDPGDGTSGFYGAPFDPATADTMSFILSGLANNVTGLVDDLAGSYPGVFGGVSGDGVLAYVLFEYQPGQRGNDPGFGITVVPEPGTLGLVGLALVAGWRRAQVHR